MKHNQYLLKQTLSEVEEVKLMLRMIFAGLKGSFNFEQSLIERVACEDEVDREILNRLFEAGSPGLLPKDLASKLGQFKVQRHQVSRRIMRMNNRFEKEFGERAIDCLKLSKTSRRKQFSVKSLQSTFSKLWKVA